MPKILSVIQPNSFEIVRDRIAEILADELDYQGVLTYDPALLGIKVFIESANPIDTTMISAVNVSLAHGGWPDLKEYDGKVKGNYVYDIDIYTNGTTTEDDDGDYLSSIILQRIIGLCRSILDNPIYKTLGYQPGFIWRVKCNDVNIRQQQGGDVVNTKMARLTFEVQAQESVDLLTGVLLAGSDTLVNIGQSANGYYYSVDAFAPGDFTPADFISTDFNT